MERKYLLISGIILATLALDQLTKWLALTFLEFPLQICPFLSLKLAFNTGAAFSFFTGGNTLLIWISIVFLGFLFFVHEELTDTRPKRVAFGLLVGGALGNLVDRVFHGGVIDMVSFTFWPNFNFADTALSTAIILLIILTLREEGKKKKKKKR